MLQDDGTRGHLVSMRNVTDFEFDKVTSAQLAVDAKVEERELSDPSFHLKTHAQSLDVLDLEGGLLSNNLVLVPRLTMNSIARCFHDGLPSS